MTWFRLLCVTVLLVLAGLVLRVRVEQVKSRIRNWRRTVMGESPNAAVNRDMNAAIGAGSAANRSTEARYAAPGEVRKGPHCAGPRMD